MDIHELQKEAIKDGATALIFPIKKERQSAVGKILDGYYENTLPQKAIELDSPVKVGDEFNINYSVKNWTVSCGEAKQDGWLHINKNLKTNFVKIVKLQDLTLEECRKVTGYLDYCCLYNQFEEISNNEQSRIHNPYIAYAEIKDVA